MPRKQNYTLDDEQLETIEQAISSEKDAKVVRRATAVRLLHLGHQPQDIAEMLMVNTATIYNWHRRWREEGLEGLRDKPRSGRPRVADERYCRVLEEALETEPVEYGYDFAIWTVDRLRAHLEKETGKSLSGERLRVLMKEMGYVYRRPTHDLSGAQDKEAHDQAEELLEELKRGPNRTILSFSLWTKRA